MGTGGGLSEKNLTPSLRADPSLLGKGEKLIRRAYVFPYSDPALQGLSEMNLTPSLRADPSLLGKGERGEALAFDQGIHIACTVGVVVAKDEVTGAVFAVIAGFVLSFDDGEGLEDLPRFAFGEAIQMKIQGVELAPQMQPPFFVPRKRRPGISEVVGKAFEIVGGVGEFQDTSSDEVREFHPMPVVLVAVGWDNGELLDIEVRQVLPADFLTGSIV